MKLMALSSRPTLPPHTGARAVDTARQGLNAQIWIPSNLLLPEIVAVRSFKTLERFSGFSEYQDTQLQNTLSNLRMLMFWVDQLWKSSVYSLKQSWFEETITDSTLAKHEFLRFSRQSPNFENPNVIIEKSHFMRPQATMIMRSRPESGLAKIALAVTATHEILPEVKVLTVQGRTLNSSNGSSAVLGEIELGMHTSLARLDGIGRVQFWDKTGNLIRHPMPAKEA
ncbi:MAG: hypothetical protein ACK551_08550 [Vampirovibrionales bacterium]